MPATITRYTFDGWNPARPSPVGAENFDVWAETDVLGVTTTRYLRGDKIDELIGRIDYGLLSQTPYWTLLDNQNSVRSVLDVNGVVKDGIAYGGFGNIASETNSAFRGMYTYTGRELDTETNLLYYRARYYDPATGKLMSEDPLRFDAGDSNLYRYVMNSYPNATDPSGKYLVASNEQLAKDFVTWLRNEEDAEYGAIASARNWSPELKDVTAVPVPGTSQWAIVARSKEDVARAYYSSPSSETVVKSALLAMYDRPKDFMFRDREIYYKDRDRGDLGMRTMDLTSKQVGAVDTARVIEMLKGNLGDVDFADPIRTSLDKHPLLDERGELKYSKRIGIFERYDGYRQKGMSGQEALNAATMDEMGLAANAVSGLIGKFVQSPAFKFGMGLVQTIGGLVIMIATPDITMASKVAGGPQTVAGVRTRPPAVPRDDDLDSQCPLARICSPNSTPPLIEFRLALEEATIPAGGLQKPNECTYQASAPVFAGPCTKVRVPK